MLGLGEDGDHGWDVPAPEDTENIFDADLMRLLACPSEDFDVLETVFSEGCLASSHAPPVEPCQGQKQAEIPQPVATVLPGSLELQQPPRKKRSRQPVSAEVASSRLEKTRARNRRAQAKFREKQKACMHSDTIYARANMLNDMLPKFVRPVRP